MKRARRSIRVAEPLCAQHRHPSEGESFRGSYRELAAKPNGLLQQVEHESRIHVDIESDDREAEVTRLEALGAKRIGFVKRWWVMEAPTGQRFCVVNPQRGALTTANS